MSKESGLISSFLVNNNIFIDRRTLELQLLSNPDFPSVKSITDTFDYFQIDNIAARVPKNSLDVLPDNFLAIMNRDGLESLEEVSVGRKIVTLKRQKRKEKLSIEKFQALWSGIVIAIEAEKNTKSKPIKFPVLSTFVIIALLIYWAQWMDLNLFSFVFFVLSTFGVLTSYLLLQETLGKHNQVVEKVCGSIGKSQSCSSVIQSKEARIFNFLSLTDLTAGYFTAQTMTILILGFDQTFFLVLGFLTLPVILYSLYAQAFVLKQWCVLCLMVSFILLAQFGIIILNISGYSFSPVFTARAIFLGGLTFSTVLFAGKLLADQRELKDTEMAYLKFKRNFGLFKATLQSQSVLKNPCLEDVYQLRFGSENPKLVITAISNPLCGYCKKPFDAYYNLLKKYTGQVQLNFVFNVPAAHKENSATRIAAKIVDLYRNSGEKEALEALKKWFDKRDVDAWQKEYSDHLDIPADAAVVLEKHKDWCVKNELAYTPVTILGDCVFPREYDIADLSYFIDGIAQEEQMPSPLIQAN